MNILRKKRKNNIKIRLKRFILLIFSLIMTTFAWITYSRILNTGVKIDINSWDMTFYLDQDEDNIADEEEERDNPIAIDVLDLYPGMEEKIVRILMKNNGETPSDILYIASEINILGEEYSLVETAPAEGENYILKHESVIADGISTTDFINEPERFPFKIVVEHSQEILSGQQGYLLVKASWPSYNPDDTEEEMNAKDELDSEWGYKIAKYLEDNIDNPDITGAFKLQIRINAIGKPRTDYDESFTAEVTSANYGEYVNYPVDINGDGNTKNDWRIFYNNGNNVYLISSGYVPVSSVKTSELGMSAANTSNIYWNNPSSLKLTINTGVANKFLLTKAEEFTTTNSSYQATATLLEKDKWTDFVNEAYAESAIGSPTIELWARSWNSLYPDNQITFSNSSSNGYYLGSGTDVSFDTVDIGDTNSLFYPYLTTHDGSNGYWLSTPAGDGSNKLLAVRSDGKIDAYANNTTDLALRPVIALKADVTATKDEGVWELHEYEKSTLETVTNDNIGDYVDIGKSFIGTDSLEDDWRILYPEDTNSDGSPDKIYLILADFLPASMIPEIDGLVKDQENYPYNVWTTGNSFALSDALTGVTDSEAWDFLANGKSTEVVGAPTGDLLMLSYNAKNRTNLNYRDFPWLDSRTEDFDLYIPHYSSSGEEYEKSKGYWFSSTDGNLYSWLLQNNGKILYTGMGGKLYGIRPVITLKANIQAERVGDVWIITE